MAPKVLSCKYEKTIQDLSRKDLVRDLDSVNIVDTHYNNYSVSKSTKVSCKELGCRQIKNI